jgi:hypothetical protein
MGDTTFAYELLTDTDRVEAIERALGGLERDHLNISMDVKAAGPGGNPAQETRLAELEQRIKDLRSERDSLKPKAS